MADTTQIEGQPDSGSGPLLSAWLGSILIGLVLIFGGLWFIFSRTDLAASIFGSEAPAPGVATAGYPAPGFELKTPDGQTVRLSDFLGKPVIVNFWATWCGPCRAEFPEFQEVSVEQSGELIIIGVNHTTADSPSLVPDFVDEFGITFPIVLDETGETIKAYRVMGLPTSVFINKEGLVDEIFTGPINKAYIESKLPGL